MELSQKNVVYIGGCGGIGSATCRLLVQKKIANLAVLDLVKDEGLIKELAAFNPSTKVFFSKIDLLSKENVEKTLKEIVSKIGHIDILVNGSGIFNEIAPEQTIGVNLLGTITSTMAALALMDKSKGKNGGLIVNLASVAGLDPFPNSAVYCASKAGVILFSRTMALDETYVKTGVSFIIICPGVTTTKLLDQIISENCSPEPKVMEKVLSMIIQQTPEDLAKNIIAAIEINKNGAVYICDLGCMKEVALQTCWDRVKRE